MNRKLHNTYSALAATAAMLVIALVAAMPVAPPQAGGPSFAATTAGELEAARVIATAIEAAAVETIESGTATRSTGTTRNHRHALVMPYFSFVPRG